MPRCAVKFCPHFKGRPNEENGDVRCHRFPTNKEQHQKWDDWVQNTNVVGIFKSHSGSGLCSKHFTQDSYQPSGRLKKTAVPFIAPVLTPEVAFKLGITSTVENFAGGSSTSGELLAREEQDGDIKIKKEPSVPVTPPQSPVQCLKRSSLANTALAQRDHAASNEDAINGLVVPAAPDKPSPSTPLITKLATCTSTSPASKLKRKAFIGDFSPSDFNTPKRARRSLDIIRHQMRSYQRREKTLHQALRRAERKIADLESLLQDFKNITKSRQESD